jgi:hypothetical protein
MIGSEIKVTLEALSDLNGQLLDAKNALDQPIDEARQNAQKESERLEQVREQRQQAVENCISNVAACEASLQVCLSCVDEDGNRPSCSSEAAALQQAEADLEQAQQALDEIDAHIANFQSQMEQLINGLVSQKETLESVINTARQEVEKYINNTIQYLKANDVAIPPTPGQSSHGSEYREARRDFFERGAAGDFPNIPTHLRGWMEQEIDRGGYYRSPGGWRGYRMPDGSFQGGNRRATHHVGHILRNLNIPENYRWELAIDNQGRTGWRTRVNNY